MQFHEWFDSSFKGHYKDDTFYPWENYVKHFPNAVCLTNATAQEILDNSSQFYDVYPIDSEDREKAFSFASEQLGIAYNVLYNNWLYGGKDGTKK